MEIIDDRHKKGYYETKYEDNTLYQEYVEEVSKAAYNAIISVMEKYDIDIDKNRPWRPWDEKTTNAEVRREQWRNLGRGFIENFLSMCEKDKE